MFRNIYYLSPTIMKKSILNVGTVLNKTEQRSINGGTPPPSACNPITNPVDCANAGCLWRANICVAPKPQP
jgi:hypothetical protein